MKFIVKEIKAKSILSKTGLPDCDWVINPYTGCRFGCKYCYAYFVGRFRHPDEEWGSYVDVKINAPELLKKELSHKLASMQKGSNIKVMKDEKVGARKKIDIGTIFFSSVTDPYQGIEAKYQLTRKCLQIFADIGYENEVGILTISSLVIRDIDVFCRLKQVEVGLTVTSTGDPISRYLETHASPNEDRIKALRRLHQAGVRTYAFVGPLLPHHVWMEKEMEKLFNELKNSGVSYIYLEHINLSNYIKERLFSYLAKDHPDLIQGFKKAQSPKYRQELDAMLENLVKKAGLQLAYSRPIYHKDKTSWGKLVR